MRETLTSRERFGLLLIDEQPDRCNVLPLVTSHAATVAGVQLKQYYTDGAVMANAQLAALEEYRYDAVSIFSEVGIIAEAMGSVFDYPDHDLPVLKTPVLTTTSLSRLKVPDPTRDGRLPVYLEAIRRCYEALGDRVPILAYVPAPFTTGMMLSDPNRFMIETITAPEHVLSINDLCLETAIAFCVELIDAGGLPIIVDPLASASIVSPRAYASLALPYERELIRFLHRYDLDVILHICGETGPILDLLPETEADLVSLDRVDLAEVVQRIAGTIRVVGNFDTSTLAFDRPESIAEGTREMVALGKTARRGYIAATGCEVPIQAPAENVRAFVGAAKEEGWYWR